MRATVLALGDLGRSPRIQLQAKALAAEGCVVDLVGFRGSSCWLVDDAPRVSTRYLEDGRAHRSRILRGVALTLSLARTLRSLKTPEVVLVQTPPAIPALYLGARFGRARRARVVFDWHNLGFSLLGLRTGVGSPEARLYERLERRSARRAHGHLCVTPQLRVELRQRFGIDAEIFQDRPSEAFARVSEESRLALRREILERVGLHRPEPRLLVVSPTSWTNDEDFGLLESAGEKLNQSPGDPIVFILSGHGELKEAFESRIAGRSAGRSRFATIWFEGRDYPRLLPGADLGLSLHASSSGVDFPMKIHDMRGSGLPVLALRFPGLSAGFTEGRDGFAFTNASDLASLLSRMIDDGEGLAALRGAAKGPTWEEGWQRDARRVIFGA